MGCGKRQNANSGFLSEFILRNDKVCVEHRKVQLRAKYEAQNGKWRTEYEMRRQMDKWRWNSTEERNFSINLIRCLQIFRNSLVVRE